MRLILCALLLSMGCSKLVDLDGLSGGARPGDGSDGGPDGSDGTPDGRDGAAGPNDADVDQRDAGEDAGPLPCPAVAGMTMSRISIPQGTFCIDQTEVTTAQYTAFYYATQGTDLSTLFVTNGCMAVTEVQPEGFPPAPGSDQLPVTGVTYCDAEAYCAYVGKSLCGDISGGPLATILLNNPTRDTWMRACSGPGRSLYPYGATYEIATCNGEGQQGNVVVPVGNLTECVTPDTDLFDMSGNVWEWVASCETDLSLSDACAVRGGANNSPPGELACDAPQMRQIRGYQSSNIGFRCCAP